MALMASTWEKVVAMAPITKDAFHIKITDWKKDFAAGNFEWQKLPGSEKTARNLAGTFLSGRSLGRGGLEAAVGLFKAAILLRQYGKKEEADGAAKQYVTAMFGQKWYANLGEDAELLGVEAHLSELRETVRLIDKKMERGDLINAGVIAEEHGLLWHLWERVHADKANAGDIYRLEAILYMTGIRDMVPELPIRPTC